jgi:hypothetical protein
LKASSNADEMASPLEARRAEIARRYKAKKKARRPVSMMALRIAELRRLFTARYGLTLPDDAAGREDVRIMAHHLARTADARRRITAYLELAAPWLPPNDVVALITAVLANPLRWRADTLAKRLNLTNAERRRLNIRTIGAVDRMKTQRAADSKQRKRLAEQARRRARGVQPRKNYRATSLSRTKPWVTLGISRTTWYRSRRDRRETSPCPI